MRSTVAIVVSLAVPKIPQIFPLFTLLGFPSIREKEKRLESHFHCLCARVISLSVDIISQIPMVVMHENKF